MHNSQILESIKKEYRQQTSAILNGRTISSIKDEKTRKKFIHLTIDILEESTFSGKIVNRKREEWEKIASSYRLQLSLDYHLAGFGGYAIYALRGLKSITSYKANEGFRIDLMTDFANFSKKSKNLEYVFKGKVLDFGCSVGWISNLIRNRFGSDAYGVDIDEKAIDLGRFFESGKLYKSLQLNGKYFFPFDNDFFNFILSKATLFEAPSTGMASYICDEKSSFKYTMDEISRVLKKDGMLLVETNISLDFIFPLLNDYPFIYVDTFHSDFSDKEWKLFQKYE